MARSDETGSGPCSKTDLIQFISPVCIGFDNILMMQNIQRCFLFLFMINAAH